MSGLFGSLRSALTKRFFSLSGFRVSSRSAFKLLWAIAATTGLIAPVFAQVCPSPAVANGTVCTVAAGTTITVNNAGAPGLNVSGTGGHITADGITVNLGTGTPPRSYIGGRVQSGGTLSLNSTNITTVQAGTDQKGVIADGPGSQVTATGATITLGTGATAVNDNVAAQATSGSRISFTNTAVKTQGATNGNRNHGLQATGTNSQITFSGGSVATASRGSYGVLAEAGGSVVLSNSATVATTGIHIAAGFIGSHGLVATGVGSTIEGTNITTTTTGTYANGARIEAGAIMALTDSTLGTVAGGSVVNPAAAARVISGGMLTLNNVLTSAMGGYGHGVSVEDAGSKAIILNSTDITANGGHANGVRVSGGAMATLANSTVLTQLKAEAAVLANGAGSTLEIIDSTIKSTASVGHGLQTQSGATATMENGSITTTGTSGIALFAGTSTITATNVAITTTGNDNAFGVAADVGSTVNLIGGSVATSGNSVRDGARAHALVARNPGGTLTVTGTAGTPVTALTTGSEAMGATADDGDSIRLTYASIKTEDTLNDGFRGSGAIGLFSVTEQVDPDGTADIAADYTVVETLGPKAHGAMAQARNDLSVETASITLNDSSITTHGVDAAGLFATLASYGSPPTGRGEAKIIANRSAVLTEGANAYGARARDNPASVTMSETTVTTTGATAHGTVAENGGLIVGTDTTISATGANANALHTTGNGTTTETANFTDSTLESPNGISVNVSGSTATISLTSTTAETNNGIWLTVAANGATISSSNLTATTAALKGAALTEAGSISNVTLETNTMWHMTGDSNVTDLTNTASTINVSAPVSNVFKKLTAKNYVGTLGTIGLNTHLGADNSPSDLLVIDGGTASGATKLNITNALGLGALTTGNGILVVNAINGATTSPGAFTLGHFVAAGGYEYELFRGSVDASCSECWYLRSKLGGGGGVGAAPIPALNSNALLALIAALLWIAIHHRRRGV